MNRVSERINEFYDKYVDDYLYNPEVTSDEQAQEFADVEGHPVYPFPYTTAQFENLVNDYFLGVPTVSEIFQMVKDYQKPVYPIERSEGIE